ncbi:hypothetical protein VFPPC_16967 [Pochonia chlamydosporia 170]|uniref:Uncharacterized protein n=1 Tax=Pochonia chlamydosporia 170 TaxID=1380566 RepID=A0A179F008_METCM|nr:hypothetical protein VFPPC_16967 [Pochonia chlamydosporia 170]OAQ58489.1 hypothetical protein VFPPC_16967 [Pochonia chlamydosporia 170]
MRNKLPMRSRHQHLSVNPPRFDVILVQNQMSNCAAERSSGWVPDHSRARRYPCQYCPPPQDSQLWWIEVASLATFGASWLDVMSTLS